MRQPWASLIAHGGKNIENRGHRVAYRGRLAIHAGKAPMSIGDEVVGRFRLRMPRPTPLPAGAIVATANLVDVHHGTDQACTCTDWAEPDAWHWCLVDVEALTDPIPHRGMPGLWPVTISI